MCVRFWDRYTGCGHEFPGAITPCKDWGNFFNVPFEHERAQMRIHDGRCKFCLLREEEQKKAEHRAAGVTPAGEA